MIVIDTNGLKYIVEKSIGKGGWGEVFLGVQSSNQEKVAIKIKYGPIDSILTEIRYYQALGSPENQKKFLTKYPKMIHIGIPRFYGWGQGKGFVFFVMELLDVTLSQILRNPLSEGVIPYGITGTFKLPQLKTVAFRLMLIIEYIHSLGLVHGDLKSQNIMVSNRQIYLTDFGSVSSYLRGSNHYNYTKMRGVVYTSPEYESRDVHQRYRLSRRGDLEALGYLLVRWHVGTLPWNEFTTNRQILASKNLFWTTYLESDLPEPIKQFLTEVGKIDYKEEPDYFKFRQIIYTL